MSTALALGAPTNSTHPAARPLTVLLIAPGRTTLKKLSRFLVQFGYDVVQAMNLEQAEYAAATKPFDLVLIDGCRQRGRPGMGRTA